MSDLTHCPDCGIKVGHQHLKDCSCYGFTMNVGPTQRDHGDGCFCTACLEAKLEAFERRQYADLHCTAPLVSADEIHFRQGRLPSDPELRKGTPVATGCLDYFPDALAAIARLSRIGNDKHNPGQPLHWSRDKSNDHSDCLIRHFMERGTIDTSGAEPVLHSTQMAWRALAILQLEIEERNIGG